MTDTEILREFALAADPVLTTSDLTEPLDMSRQGIHSRLVDLENSGYLDSREVGANARVWWITNEGMRYLEAQRDG